jgi:hypothetical protein
MATVLAGARVGKRIGTRLGQPDHIIQLAIGSNPASEVIAEPRN